MFTVDLEEIKNGSVNFLKDVDVRSCVLRTFLDRSSRISKILYHISFLLVNLGFAIPIKLLFNLKNRDKIPYN